MSKIYFMFVVMVTIISAKAAPVPSTSMKEDSSIIRLNESWFDYNHTQGTTDGGDLLEQLSLQDAVMFEGDLKISYEQYKEYYLDDEDIIKTEAADAGRNTNGIGSGSRTGLRVKRAGKKASSAIWPSGEVYYTFHSSVNTKTKWKIRKTMDDMETKTCLKFINVSTTSNELKVTFTTNQPGCYVNRIGRGTEDGQIINLGRGCVYKQVIIHTLCHTVGFWHEQNRPDRDEYIEIQWNNIIPSYKYNFQKIARSKVTHFDTKYDYSSIMHYGRSAWSQSDCSGESCITIAISNKTEYELQGKPHLGWSQDLSATDILQINRMYAEECGTRALGGIKGLLNVTIMSGVNLPDTDGFLAGKPEPYVTVSARYPGGYIVHSTSVESGTNVNWNQELNFGGKEWLFIKIEVFDRDPGDDDVMIKSLTIYDIKDGSHTSLKHCEDQSSCDTGGYITYGYGLEADYVDDCLNDDNACLNGGTCIDGVFSYTCNCTEGYEGDKCQYARGNLRFYARFGVNLPNYDGWLAGVSDPYIKVIAQDHYGNTVEKTTSRIQNNNILPEWNQWLNFGTGAWKQIEVRVYDKDTFSDDALSSPTSYSLVRKKNFMNYRVMKCYRGFVVFDCYFD